MRSISKRLIAIVLSMLMLLEVAPAAWAVRIFSEEVGAETDYYTVTFTGGAEASAYTPVVQLIEKDSAITVWPQEPNAEGKRFAGWLHEGSAFGAGDPVRSDMTLTPAFVNIDKYTVTIEYRDEIGNGELSRPVRFEYDDRSTDVDTVSSPQIDGMVLADAQQAQVTIDAAQVISELGADVKRKTIVVYYKRADATYTVQYYFENLAGDDYVYDQAYDRAESGIAGTTVSVEPLSVSPDGFSFDHGDQGVQLTGAGGQVLKGYYKRNENTLAFDPMGGAGVDSIVARYEAPVALPRPERAGYTFDAWYTSADYADETRVEMDGYTMPAARSTTLYARWTGDEVKYRIIYHVEKAGISGEPDFPGDYMVRFAASGKAPAGSDVTLTSDAALKYLKDSGQKYELLEASDYLARLFAFVKSDTQTIDGDGTTQVNVYFKRQIFEMIFSGYMTGATAVYYGTENALVKVPGDTHTLKVKLDQDISDIWPWKVDLKDVTKPFKLWSGYYSLRRMEVFNVGMYHAMAMGDYAKNFKITGETNKFKVAATYGAQPDYVTRKYYLEMLPGEEGVADGDKIRQWGEDIGGDGGLYKHATKWDSSNQQINTASGGYMGWPGTTAIVGFEPVLANQKGYRMELENLDKKNEAGQNLFNLYYYMKRKTYALSFVTGKGGMPVDISSKGLDYSKILYELSLSAYEPDGFEVDVTTNRVDNVNYTFKGWRLGSADGPEFDWTTATMPADDVIIYANWQADQITVTPHYDVEGVDDLSVKASAGTAIGELSKYGINVPHKPGHRFTGWYKDEDLAQPFADADKLFVDTDIYAGWAAIGVEYTVRYINEETQTPVADDFVGQGYDGHTVTAKAKSVPLMTAKEQTLSLILSKDAENVITFYYVPNPDKALKYTVSYGYFDGDTWKQLEQSDERTTSDTRVVENAIVIPGYYPLHETQTFLLAKDNAVFKFEYKVESVPYSVVHIYQDDGGAYDEQADSTTIAPSGDAVRAQTIRWTTMPRNGYELASVEPGLKVGDRRYTVAQSDIDRGGVKITLKYRLLADVEWTKVWDDGSLAATVRPSADDFVMTLYADEGEVSALPNVAGTDGNAWTYTWAQLPVFDESGDRIDYTATESVTGAASLYGYQASTEGTTITNTYTLGEVLLIKTGEGVEGDEVALTLTDGEKSTYTKLFSHDGTGWTAVGEGAKNGAHRFIAEPGSYSISEATVQGSDYTLVAESSYVVTAKTVTEITARNLLTYKEFVATKTWADGGNANKLRPDELTLTLYGNGQALDPQPVYDVYKDGDAWTYTWTNLPRYDAADGYAQIAYSAVEEEADVPTGYTITQAEANAITNTLGVGETEVVATKVWDDGGNANSTRPDALVLTLYADGKKVSENSAPVQNGNGWTYEWTGLPIYDEANEYSKIEYTVREDAVPEGYRADRQEVQAGSIITNTLGAGETEFMATKTWVDGGNANKLRPDELTLTLYGNGQALDPQPVYDVYKDGDVWTYTWTNLPRYDAADGYAQIAYSAVEEEADAPAGYTITQAEANAITNTLGVGETEFTATKVWVDGSNRHATRPAGLELTLLADDVPVAGAVPVVRDMASDVWTYTWTGLPKYDVSSGYASINYTVKERVVPTNYDMAQEGSIITNALKNDEIEFVATKVWADEGDMDGSRPASLALTLYADGAPVPAEAVVTGQEGDTWTYTWRSLPKYDLKNDYAPIKYTVDEPSVPEGYEKSVSGAVVTNTHEPVKTQDITATKVWDDDGNTGGMRPGALSLTLYANGAAVSQSPTITGQSGASWTYTWEKMPVYDDDKREIAYTVDEISVPDGYEKSVSGMTVTNTLRRTETITVTARKVWVDGNNVAGVRPDSIDLRLYADGRAVSQSPTIAKSGNTWTYIWRDMPRTDSAGRRNQPISYTIDEVTVPDGYLKSVSGMTVTNTLDQVNDVTVVAHKVWVDDDNSAGQRPDSLSLTLLGNGAVVSATPVVTGKNGNTWTYTWTGLARYSANGGYTEVKYTVDESAVPTAYRKSISGDGLTITNTVRTVTVYFVDWNGTIIKTETLPYMGTATPPNNPEREGWVFEGWNGNWRDVVKDEWVFARYAQDERYELIQDGDIPLAGGYVTNVGECYD